MSGAMNTIVLLLFLCSMGGFVLGRIMRWKPVWLASLIVFILMIIAIFIIWYCFPQTWNTMVNQVMDAW